MPRSRAGLAYQESIRSCQKAEQKIASRDGDGNTRERAPEGVTDEAVSWFGHD